MKKIFVIAGSLILLYLQSFSQTSSSQHNRVPSMQSLIGRWEIVGTKEDGGRLEIVDSSTIVITYGGEKKALSGFQLDFQSLLSGLTFCQGQQCNYDGEKYNGSNK